MAGSTDLEVGCRAEDRGAGVVDSIRPPWQPNIIETSGQLGGSCASLMHVLEVSHRLWSCPMTLVAEVEENKLDTKRTIDAVAWFCFEFYRVIAATAYKAASLKEWGKAGICAQCSGLTCPACCVWGRCRRSESAATARLFCVNHLITHRDLSSATQSEYGIVFGNARTWRVGHRCSLRWARVVWHVKDRRGFSSRVA